MSEETRKEFVLQALRIAALRSQAWQLEINNIGVALKAGMIDTAQAMRWIADIGGLTEIGFASEVVATSVDKETKK